MTTFTLISTLLAPVVLVALYWWYGRRRNPVIASSPARAFTPVGVPLGVFLHPGHSWAGLNISGEMRLGVDELLTQALGGVDRVDLPEVGTRVERGKPITTLWRKGRALPVISPVSGTVVDVNRSLKRSSIAVGSAAGGERSAGGRGRGAVVEARDAALCRLCRRSGDAGFGRGGVGRRRPSRSRRGGKPRRQRLAAVRT